MAVAAPAAAVVQLQPLGGTTRDIVLQSASPVYLEYDVPLLRPHTRGDNAAAAAASPLRVAGGRPRPSSSPTPNSPQPAAAHLPPRNGLLAHLSPPPGDLPPPLAAAASAQAAQAEAQRRWRRRAPTAAPTGLLLRRHPWSAAPAASSSQPQSRPLTRESQPPSRPLTRESQPPSRPLTREEAGSLTASLDSLYNSPAKPTQSRPATATVSHPILPTGLAALFLPPVGGSPPGSSNHVTRNDMEGGRYGNPTMPRATGSAGLAPARRAVVPKLLLGRSASSGDPRPRGAAVAEPTATPSLRTRPASAMPMNIGGDPRGYILRQEREAISSWGKLSKFLPQQKSPWQSAQGRRVAAEFGLALEELP